MSHDMDDLMARLQADQGFGRHSEAEQGEVHARNVRVSAGRRPDASQLQGISGDSTGDDLTEEPYLPQIPEHRPEPEPARTARPRTDVRPARPARVQTHEPQVHEARRRPAGPELDPEAPIAVRHLEASAVSLVLLQCRRANEHQRAMVWYPRMHDARAIRMMGALMEIGVVLTAWIGDHLAGSIAMAPKRHEWAADGNEFLPNQWFYVEPWARTEGVAEALISRACSEAEELGLPMSMTIWSGMDVELKDEFLRRHGLTYTGGNFMYEPERPAHVRSGNNHHPE